MKRKVLPQAPVETPISSRATPTAATLKEKPERSRERLSAEMAVSAPFTGAEVAVAFSKGVFGDLSFMDTASVLTDKVLAVRGGDMKEVEGLLTVQAVALNTIFTELARRAALNMGKHLDATDRYLRLALKAQGQCRATLETLAAIKNPPVVFARQANIANGPQQINNGMQQAREQLGEPSRVENLNGEPIKLLETHGDPMDPGATDPPVARHSEMASVGALNRTANRRR